MKTLGVGGVLAGHIRWPRFHDRLNNWKARQSLRELEDAEDWLLKDIGLTRNDITWALGLPLSVNSADELNKRVYRGRTSGTQSRGARNGRRGDTGEP